MARTLFLVWCATVAVATRYSDYSDARMPQYGSLNEYDGPRDASQADDYQGHSPDASASLDYKYEEGPAKTEQAIKESDDPDWWQKRVRKQKGLVRPLEVGVDAKKYEQEDDETPTFPRHLKHRTRHKADFESDDGLSSRRSKKYSRNSKDLNNIDRKDYINKDFPDNKHKLNYDSDDIARRTKSRKTRDQHRPRKNIDSDLESIRSRSNAGDIDAYEDDDMQIERRLKGEVNKEIVPMPADENLEHGLSYTTVGRDIAEFNMRESESDLLGHNIPEQDILELETPGRDREGPRRGSARNKRPETHIRERYRPTARDDDDINEPKVRKHKPKEEDEYDNYYTMKRAQNIKSKLPSLLRRSTVQATPTKTKWFQKLWTNRRKMADYDEEEDASVRPFVTSFSTSVTSTTTSTPSSTTPTTRITPISTSTTPVSTFVWTSPIRESSTDSKDTQLSLAEQSRMSILKKAQRKEELAPLPTKKPPVLLQVTKRLATVVMVVPPSSQLPWMRLHDISEDTPERLEKVKRLMRHKLVSEAKNMRDLTDNWDSMVCDYIDVSLLENTSTKLNSPSAMTLITIVCVLLKYSPY